MELKFRIYEKYKHKVSNKLVYAAKPIIKQNIGKNPEECVLCYICHNKHIFIMNIKEFEKEFIKIKKGEK